MDSRDCKAKVKELLYEYARRQKIQHRYLWSRLYDELFSRTGINVIVRSRTSRVAVAPAQVLDVMDRWDKALDVAREIFR